MVVVRALAVDKTKHDIGLSAVASAKYVSAPSICPMRQLAWAIRRDCVWSKIVYITSSSIDAWPRVHYRVPYA